MTFFTSPALSFKLQVLESVNQFSSFLILILKYLRELSELQKCQIPFIPPFHFESLEFYFLGGSLWKFKRASHNFYAFVAVFVAIPQKEFFVLKKYWGGGIKNCLFFPLVNAIGE